MAETSSTRSSSTSGSTRARTSATSSLPTSITSVSIISSFTPPPPLTTNVGNGGGSNGGGFGGNNSGSIASSASLYLYTFLATLVLLLSVSAAIVVRSFLLRRRHRQMIEEAIRNGTWIPPAPGGRGGPRVDLSKKPLMWEAYLDLHSQSQNQTHQQHPSIMMLEERDWDSIKPVMATYVNDPIAKKVQNGSGSAPGGVGDDGSSDGRDSQGSTGTGLSARLLGAFSRRARDVLRTSPSGPTLPLTHPVSNGTGTTNTRQGSAVNLSTPAQDVPMSEIIPPEPPRVRVAVLIAMPRPHSTTASSNSSSSSSSSSSTAPQIPPTNTSEDEEELPHLEMGVAELNVSDSHLSGIDTHDMHIEGKGKVRESMASAGSV